MRLNRAGFSLIELLVALMISGLLATVMFQLMSGQGRFVEIQSAREEVQQNSRAALDLIGNDLRTLPGGESLVRADDDSITVRTARITPWTSHCLRSAARRTLSMLEQGSSSMSGRRQFPFTPTPFGSRLSGMRPPPATEVRWRRTRRAGRSR
jgi:prepilin-type N-terminal cleavage/methylation domain-containing protein